MIIATFVTVCINPNMIYNVDIVRNFFEIDIISCVVNLLE